MEATWAKNIGKFKRTKTLSGCFGNWRHQQLYTLVHMPQERATRVPCSTWRRKTNHKPNSRVMLPDWIGIGNTRSSAVSSMWSKKVAQNCPSVGDQLKLAHSTSCRQSSIHSSIVATPSWRAMYWKVGKVSRTSRRFWWGWFLYSTDIPPNIQSFHKYWSRYWCTTKCGSGILRRQ